MTDNSNPWNILMGYMGIPQPEFHPARPETSTLDYYSSAFPPNITGGKLLAIPVSRTVAAGENVNNWQNAPPSTAMNPNLNWPAATAVGKFPISAASAPPAVPQHAPEINPSGAPPLGDQVGSAFLGGGGGSALGRRVGKAYVKQAIVDALRSQGMTEAEIDEALEVGGGAVEGLPGGEIGALLGGLGGLAGALGLDWAIDRRRPRTNSSTLGNSPKR